MNTFEELAPPLPQLCEGDLNASLLCQLVADLNTHARVFSVREKRGPGHASPEERTLTEAVGRLLTGMVRAVQVRYEYDGAEWCDTLLGIPGGACVVRCRYSDSPRIAAE